jgi:hypothetical protein
MDKEKIVSEGHHQGQVSGQNILGVKLVAQKMKIVSFLQLFQEGANGLLCV